MSRHACQCPQCSSNRMRSLVFWTLTITVMALGIAGLALTKGISGLG